MAVTSMSATRVPATEIVVGDRIGIFGTMAYATIEWVRHGSEGDVFLAGVRSNGNPHVSTMSAGAQVSRVFDLKED